jgi:hypothetical protein
MPDMLIRDVPEPTHEAMKRRAEAAGMSLQSFVVKLFTDEAAKPSLEEWFAQLDALPPVHTTMTGAEAVQAARDELM